MPPCLLWSCLLSGAIGHSDWAEISEVAANVKQCSSNVRAQSVVIAGIRRTAALEPHLPTSNPQAIARRQLPGCYSGPVLAEMDFVTARDFGTALLLGALLGIEREKRNAREGGGIAGLRSFIMLAQMGAVGGFLAVQLGTPWILAGVVVAVAGVVIAGYVTAARNKPENLGLTTEFAAIVCCLLGALSTTGHRELAIGLGVTTAALLAYKHPLHQIVGRLNWDDVLVGLRLLLATFIVLPLLPDEAVDPWGAINPYKLWLLVLLISSLSLVGYVATRWLGAGHGTAITGASGGLVSSTAVTLTFVKQSHERPGDGVQLAGGILLSWGVMFGRVLVAATIVYPPLFMAMVIPFVAMTLAAGGAALWCLRRGTRAAAEADSVPLRNPFSLLAAGKFALLFAVVQLLLRLGQTYLPGQGVYVIAALAGLTNVDAITLSMAEHAKTTADGLTVAVVAIAVASTSNTLVKAGVAVGAGHRSLRWPILVGTAAILAVGATALLLGPF